MGLRRHGDIPGEEIPQVYFDWVRRRDARLLARVFEHNRQDIVSLAALAVLACQWVEEAPRRGPARRLQPRRACSSGRGSTSAARPSTAARSSRGPGALRGPALLRLAWRAKRAGDHDARRRALGARRARRARSKAGASWPCTTSTARRDLDAALAAVERGMRLVERGRQRETCGPGTWPRASSGRRERLRGSRRSSDAKARGAGLRGACGRVPAGGAPELADLALQELDEVLDQDRLLEDRHPRLLERRG